METMHQLGYYLAIACVWEKREQHNTTQAQKSSLISPPNFPVIYKVLIFFHQTLHFHSFLVIQWRPFSRDWELSLHCLPPIPKGPCFLLVDPSQVRFFNESSFNFGNWIDFMICSWWVILVLDAKFWRGLCKFGILILVGVVFLIDAERKAGIFVVRSDARANQTGARKHDLLITNAVAVSYFITHLVHSLFAVWFWINVIGCCMVLSSL